MSTTQYEGILSEVDSEGNVHEMYPLVYTDTSLQVAGKPADAKTVGDKINEVVDEVVNEINDVKNNIPAIDTELTISGKAADAKKVGDKITEVERTIKNTDAKFGGLRFGKETNPETGEKTVGYYEYDEEAGTDVLVPFTSSEDGGINLYNVRATFVDPNNATLDLSFVKNYQKLSVDDIYLYIRRGAEHESSSITTGELSYTYDSDTGLVTITSSIYYFRKEANHIFNFLVVIKPKIVIKVAAISRDTSNHSITYDLSSFGGHKDFTGYELLWWMPYFIRTSGGSARYVGRPWVSSYDPDTGILVISDTEHDFPEELLTTETVFFV